MLLRSNRCITKIETQKNNTNNDINPEITPFSISEFTSQFFNDSSVAWKMNKVQNENATYQYRCAYYYSKTKRCRELPCSQLYCKKHMK